MSKESDVSEGRDGSKRPYYELFWNLLLDSLSMRLHVRLFRPLMTNIYITKRCNLRCPYCYPPGNEPDMALASGLALLEKIRPKSPAINFTGGEPLVHPDLGLLLKRARELHFRPILVSTNAYQIDKLIGLLPLIDNVLISLDSMNESINDTLTGIPGSTRAIMENIGILARLRSRFKFNISIHAVLCDNNLDNIEDLVAFCDSLRITLSVSPQHDHMYPHEGLKNNSRYESAIQKLRRLKRGGAPIACSMSFLRKIERFSEHKCYPLFSPRVEPDGTVYFPCYCIRDKAYNLANYPNLYSLMRNKAEWMDKRPECRNRCFMTCYMEVERYVSNPLCLLKEAPVRRLALGRRMQQPALQRSGELERRNG